MSLFFLTLSSRPRALKPHKLQKSILWHTVVNTDVCMDLFVFVSKQCSIAEPSGWPWREREIYIYIHCVNLGLVFQAFQCMSHPSYIAHQIYIYICTFVVSLKIGKMMVVTDIYICVYITFNMNIYILIYIYIYIYHMNII